MPPALAPTAGSSTWRKPSLRRAALVLLLPLALLTTAASSSAYEVQPFTATYTIFRGGKDIGQAEMAVAKLSSNRYQMRFHSEASMFFLRDKRQEISEFHVIGATLSPLTYQYRQKSTFKKASLWLAFDAVSHTVTIDHGQQTQWRGELDNQLYRLQAQRAIAQGKQVFEANIINYRGQRKHYRFKVLERQQVTLPYGTVDAVKVATIRPNSSRNTYTWFSPELGFVPVKIQQFKNGKEQGNLRLASLTLPPAATSDSHTDASDGPDNRDNRDSLTGPPQSR